MPVCDGCGAPADDAHIRRRIERLELATRFRPIHIQVLLIDAAPPTRPQDYFYRAAANRGDRSVGSRNYFDEIVRCSALTIRPEMCEDSALAEFQHRGFYLAHVRECPAEPADELGESLERLGPVMVRRVEKSYKPKYVVLLSTSLGKLIPQFERSEMRDRLILDHGKTFLSPLENSATSRSSPTVSLSDQLKAALPQPA
jgi:hypothetical protein